LKKERDTLVEEILASLEAVSARLDNVTKDRTREVSILKADLESEREARRGWQEKAGTLREQLSSMEHARFVLVLIDADADIYLFHEQYLSRGVQGGQSAADKFMEKVREHLASLVPEIEDVKSIPVMVKAYANLSGLAQACVRDGRLNSVGDITQFWIGFTRRYPLIDFVDVGSGKEESDNKLREVLAFHVNNPQCEHILLACCHDAGYVPVLRQYAAQPASSDRITLLSSGAIRSDMSDLGFRTTRVFESLFDSRGSPPVPTAFTVWKNLQCSPVVKQPRADLFTAESSKLQGKPVINSGRLRPILRDGNGNRIDKSLNVNGKLAIAMRNLNLCNWHYLRSDCQNQNSGCNRDHKYPRPLSPEKYDALWFVARQGMCRSLRKGGSCKDDQCIYGHVFVKS